MLDGTNTRKGEEWKCSVEPVDIKGKHGTESYSPPKTIENSPPELKKEVPDLSGNEGTSFSLNMREYFYDADVEDGVDKLSYYHSTLSHFSFSISEDIVTFTPHAGWHGSESVVITASDGEASISSNAFTLTITHENIVPVALLSANRYEIKEGMSVGFDASQSYDKDGSIVGYKFHFGDGYTTKWLSTPYVNHKYDSAGVYYAYVKVRDNNGAVAKSANVMITVRQRIPVQGNHAPVIDSISIQPSSPREDDDLSCYASVSDVDGNLHAIEFKWIIDGNVVKTSSKLVHGSSAERSDTLYSSFTHAGDKVRCEVMVSDDKGAYKTRYTEVTISGIVQKRNPSITSIHISPSSPTPYDTCLLYTSPSPRD